MVNSMLEEAAAHPMSRQERRQADEDRANEHLFDDFAIDAL